MNNTNEKIDLKDFLKDARETETISVPIGEKKTLEFVIKKITQKELVRINEKFFVFDTNQRSQIVDLNNIKNNFEFQINKINKIKKAERTKEDLKRLKQLEIDLKKTNEKIELQMKNFLEKDNNSEKVNAMIEKICMTFVVSPKITDTDTGLDNEIFIDFLSDAILAFVYNRLNEFSGITQKAPSDIEKQKAVATA